MGSILRHFEERGLCVLEIERLGIGLRLRCLSALPSSSSKGPSWHRRGLRQAQAESPVQNCVALPRSVACESQQA